MATALAGSSHYRMGPGNPGVRAANRGRSPDCCRDSSILLHILLHLRAGGSRRRRMGGMGLRIPGGEEGPGQIVAVQNLHARPQDEGRLAGEGADHAGDAGAHRRDAGVAGVEARGPGEVDKVALLRLVEPEDGANSGQNLLRGGDVPPLLQTDVSVGVFPCSLAACAARASGRSPGRSHSPIAASVTRWRRRHCSAGTASWRPAPGPKSALQQNATPPEQTAWAAILFATSQQSRTARIDQEKRRLSY